MVKDHQGQSGQFLNQENQKIRRQKGEVFVTPHYWSSLKHLWYGEIFEYCCSSPLDIVIPDR